MPEFTDNKGRRWDVAITFGTVDRLLEDKIDIMALAEEKYAGFLALLDKPKELLAIIWAIVKPQAQKQNVSGEEFRDSIAGPEMSAAKEGFVAAFTNFIPDERIRSSLTATLKKIETAQEEHWQTVMAKMDQRMEEQIQKRLKAMDVDALLDQAVADSMPPTPTAKSGALLAS